MILNHPSRPSRLQLRASIFIFLLVQLLGHTITSHQFYSFSPMDPLLIYFFNLLTWSPPVHYFPIFLVRCRVSSLPSQSGCSIIIPLLGSGTLYDSWRLLPTSRFQFSRDSTLLRISSLVARPVVRRSSSQTPIDK